jgi:hypothetical protein
LGIPLLLAFASTSTEVKDKIRSYSSADAGPRCWMGRRTDSILNTLND